MSDLDFEKIRLEVVNNFNEKFIKTDSFLDQLIPILTELSSKITREMLIKYHEELNSK